MAFRIVTGLAVLILLYCLFEWGRLAWLDHDARTPAAEFLLLAAGQEPHVTLIMDYRCGNCGAIYKAFDELRGIRPDLTYSVRPVPYIDMESDKLVRLVMAAGRQGKFAELHQAFAEKGGEFPESFLRETLSLYGMAYEELIERGQSEKIDAMIADNVDDALWFGADAVPMVIIGTQAHRLPQPLEEVKVDDFTALLAPAR